MIQVKVCDRRRADAFAAVGAQARENSGAAVEQEAPARLCAALDEVAGLCAAGVGPGRR
jgi:hypothetical protein